MVIWNEKLACGSSRIDLQHQMLINNINHLEGMLASSNHTPEECAFLVHLVEFLETYAEMHFQFEEDCMERNVCPAHKQNKEAHQQYRDFFSEFKRRYTAEGLRPEILQELHEAASAWIENHILRVDTQLKSCLKSATAPA